MNPVKPGAAILATALWGPGLFVGLFVTAMSAMMFDAPGSEANPWTKLLFAAVASGPLLCLVSLLGSWIAWAVTRSWGPERASAGAALRGVVAALPLLAVLFVVIGIVLLEVKCGGNFACRP